MADLMEMAPSTTVFFSWLSQPFLNRIQHINPFWTCCNKLLGTSLGPKKNIQNGVDIHDGDFTFSHQSEHCLFTIFKPINFKF
jgi:hypothetical protein